MTTLADIALVVAKQLGRTTADGTAIIDLETEIKDEIANAVRFYNRKPLHLLEQRGGTLTTVAGQTWYSEVDAGQPFRADEAVIVTDSESVIVVSEALNVDQIIDIHYMRENPGASGLNEPLGEVSYVRFESMFEGNTPQGQPEFFTRYGGQIGIWPTPNAANTIYWSGIVKPGVPTSDSHRSVWFFNANELIEAAAARRVCSKYLRDNQRAQAFAAEEQLAYRALQGEYINTASTGRLRAHD